MVMTSTEFHAEEKEYIARTAANMDISFSAFIRESAKIVANSAELRKAVKSEVLLQRKKKKLLIRENKLRRKYKAKRAREQLKKAKKNGTI